MTNSLTSCRSGPLSGVADVPGDKSISHRALILGALAKGTTRITGLLESDDVLRTAAAMRQLGAEVEKEGPDWVVEGAPWRAPDRAIYCGNAGTGARLLMGAVAGCGIDATFQGDQSLSSRPMGRILDPLKEMGVRSTSAEGRLPVTIHAGTIDAIHYRLPKPSAQIKSAVLLAALGASGTTLIEEPEPSRDHTERMLPLFGVALEIEALEGGGRNILLKGPAALVGTDVIVPADPSSVAFPVAGALMAPGSTLSVSGMLLSDTRTGLYDTLRDMGADLRIDNRRLSGGEEVGDIHVRASTLKGIDVPIARVPSMIDEFPILAVIAATAQGTTRMTGIGELRVKESDRVAATETMLRENGVAVRSGADWLEITGGKAIPGGAVVQTHHDHRIAMSALILGLVSEQPVTIDDSTMIGTSFPNFRTMMGSLGAMFADVS